MQSERPTRDGSAGAVPARRRGLGLLVVGEGISVAGDWVLITAAAIVVFQETGSTTAVSILLALSAVATVVLGPFAGAVADRYDRRLLMVTADAGSAVALGICATAYGLGSHLWVVYGSVLAVGVLAAFDRPASEALLPSLTDEDGLGRANSALRLSTRLAMIGGPALASGLMGAGGFRLVLGVDAVSFVASAWLVTGIARPATAFVARAHSTFRSALDGIGYAASRHNIRTVIAAIGVTMFVAPIVNAGTLALVSDELKLPESRYGILLSAEGVGALVLAVAFIYLGPKLKLLLTGAGALIATGAATVALSTASGLGPAAAAMAVMGMGVVGLQVAFASYLQQESSDELRGRVMSLVSMVASLAGLLGFALAGPFVELVGVRNAFSVAGLIMNLSALPVLLLVWTSIRRPAITTA